MLKRLLYIAILGLITASCGRKSPAASLEIPDSIYNLEYVRTIANRDGGRADQILDSLEHREFQTDYATIPDYKLHFARAYVASRQLRPNLAINHLLRGLKNPAALRDTVAYINALTLMGGEYGVLGRFDDCLAHYTPILNISKLLSDKSLYNRTLLNRSISYFQTGDYKAALADIRAARDGMIRQSYTDNRLSIISTYELEAQYLTGANDRPQAIKLLQRALKDFSRITAQELAGTEYEQIVNYNFRKAHMHVALATLFAREHRPDSSAHHYKAWRAALPGGIQPVISSEFFDRVLAYYTTTGQFDKALSYSYGYNDIFGHHRSDTVTMFSVVMHSNLSNIYAAKGDYRNAWKHLYSAKEMADNLNNRSNNALNAEMAAIYDDAERRQQIVSQRADIHSQRIYIVSLSAVVLLALGLGALAWRNYKRARTKNKVLVSQIKELYNIRKMYNPTSPIETPSVELPRSGLQERFDNAMQREKLYLQPCITRQSVAATLGTNVTYLSRAIREGYDMTFSEYLNWLRLEHAKQILLRDNETKIEAIAMNSGFNSVRTFYRLFRDKYGVAPNEYRNIIITNK